MQFLLSKLDLNNKVKTNKKIEYYNYICAFDIETSSFYEDDEKKAIMYEWSFALNGDVIIGRTWSEFLSMLDTIQNFLHLNNQKRLVIYVHNLSYEFQFMRKWIEWEKVFAIDKRKVAYALSVTGFEFRCSYLLTNLSLNQVAKNLTKYNIRKLVGNLDYKKVRHSDTPLTQTELDYCINDVLIVSAHIQECLITEYDISTIPMTNTGYVRRFFRQNCLPKKNYRQWYKYHNLMMHLTLDVDEYMELKQAFQGGFTHANAINTMKVLNNVTSYDFTSSYPAAMVAEQYPMSKSWLVEVKNRKQFEFLLNHYCCIFEISFKNIEHCTTYDDILSHSKCRNVKGAVLNNDRIVKAEYLTTTITNVDYECIKHFYKWDKFIVKKVRCYRKQYLPTPFVKCILDLYADKTKLKNIDGQEQNYLLKKGMLNSAYGMCVTDVLQDLNEYDNDIGWKDTETPDVVKVINRYNKSKKRFIFYPWGVFVTAYARRNLYSGILACKNNYIYSDTDSIKLTNADSISNYIINYNNQIQAKIKKACEYHGIDFAKASPLTSEGVAKPLGVWDYDGHYKKFKTLGAKRYLYEKEDNTMTITVAGVGKKSTIDYLQKRYKTNDKVFEHFDTMLEIPAEFTGKNTHTYIDETISGLVIDYLGATSEYYEKSFIHLEEVEYSMIIPQSYIDYLLNAICYIDNEIGG